MDIVSLFFIAVGLAMDAFSVAVTDGITLRRVRIRDSFLVGVFFGGSSLSCRVSAGFWEVRFPPIYSNATIGLHLFCWRSSAENDL